MSTTTSEPATAAAGAEVAKVWYAVEVQWCSEWVRLPGQYSRRDDAEWSVARWYAVHTRGNKTDTGFRVVVE